MNIVVLYRYCDKGKIPKIWGDIQIQKNVILSYFLKIFKDIPIYFFADNCEKSTIEYLQSLCPKKIFKSFLGNSKSFVNMMEILKKLEMSLEDVVLLQEDDYLYLPNSAQLIKEGINISDYVSLYDHPDKYLNGFNPYVKGNGETCKVRITPSSHWKYTNSTTMTFATRYKTLIEDYEILIESCKYGEIPQDFIMFTKLLQKGRTLITPMPGRATHCDGKFISPLINWESYLKTKIENI
jgi:hypothetical protein